MSCAEFELESDLLADDLATGQDRDVLEHRLATITEAWGLHRNGVERATELVDDEGGKRLALDVLGDHHERLAALDDLLEDRQEIRNRGDLLVRNEDVGVLEHGFHALGIGDHVRGDVALVELHALDELELSLQALRLFNGDDAVLADLLHRVGDGLADGGVSGGDRRDLRDLLALGDRDRLLLDGLHDRLNAELDALLELDRVGAGSHVLQAGCDQRLGENGGSGGPVTGDVVGLARHFLDQLGAHILEGLLELDLLGDRDSIVGDGRRAELLVQHDVPALGADGDLHGVRDPIDPSFEMGASLDVEQQLLGHGSSWYVL